MVPALPRLREAAIANHHDDVWARLPFLVPMAIAASRRRADDTTRELARLIIELHPLLLGHLSREEALLARRAAASVTTRIRDGIHQDHVAVIALMDRLRAVAGTAYQVRAGADRTECVLYRELARLDEHVQAMIALEERPGVWPH